MIGTTMIVMGIALAAGSIVAGYLIISQDCAIDGAPGCDAGIIELISRLMISDTGLFFWLAWVAGVFLIWGGVRFRSAGR